MKNKRKLIEDYFKTTGYEAPNGMYKVCPKTLVENFYDFLVKNDTITVEVEGGVAYCGDERVNIIDYDDLKSEGK